MKHYLTENDIGEDGNIHFNRIRERMEIDSIERAALAQGIQFFILEDYQYERVKNEGKVMSTEFGIFLHGEAVANYYEDKLNEKDAQAARLKRENNEKERELQELRAQLAALNGGVTADKVDKRRKRVSSDVETTDVQTENVDINE
jgi:hypothetical protein